MGALRESQRFFGERVEAYRTSAAHGNQAELAAMLALLGDVRGRLALDVATGGGQTARALEGAGARVVATDATRGMLVGQARPGVVADAHRLPFRDEAFDVVASRIAPHHFTDLSAFCAEAARVLAPGGRFYVFDLTTPADDARAAAAIDAIERLRDRSHVHSHSVDDWHRALAGTPLRVERVSVSHSDFDAEAWVSRARMPHDDEADLRDALARQRGRLGGYGLTPEGWMRVLRVELLASR